MNSLTVILALLLAAHSPASAQETLPIKIGTNCTFEGPSGVSGFRNHIDAAGAAADGGVMPQTYIQDGVMSERSTALVLQYAKASKVKNIPCAMCAAQTCDAMYLLPYALFRTKAVDGPSVKAALENLNQRISGVLAIYQKPFSENDHEALDSSALVLGCIRNGQAEYANQADANRGALFSRSKLAVQ